MNSKLTLKYMQDFCDKKELNCKILDKFYEHKNYQNVLKVVVQFEDNSIKTVIWNNFKNRNKNNTKTYNNWTPEKAFMFCREHDFYPLPEAVFKNVDTTFPCRDKNNFIFLISITNLKRFLNKQAQYFHMTKNNPYAVHNIQNYCKLYKPDFIFLDKKIDNTKKYYHFKYIGELNKPICRYFKCTLDYFLNGEGGMYFKTQNSISKNAQKIKKILEEAHINFTLEQSFPDLKGKNSTLLRFDFAIYDKNQKLQALIEYDSEIHFQYIPYIHKTKQNFLAAQERDRRKNSYCLSHNIRLYRIPYFSIDNIKNFSDLFQEEFFVKSKWHNDMLIKRRIYGNTTSNL